MFRAAHHASIERRASRFKWAVTALLASTPIFFLAGPAEAGTSSGLSAATVSTATPTWAAHLATLQAGGNLVLELDRPVSEGCTLRVKGPHAPARRWTYGTGSGPLLFGIDPPSTVTRGRWHFLATCFSTDLAPVGSAATTEVVKGSVAGRDFIVGPSGPSFEVPVTSGPTDPVNLPPVGGKGGDPGNDYPWQNVPQDSGLDPWGEYFRECTSFVAWALYSRNGYVMPFHDNAIGWGYDAEARGITVNGTPAVGAVAWSTKLPFGHVAWVDALVGGSVQIEEYNEYGNGTYDQRTVPASTFQYIHFSDITPPTTQPVQPTQPPPPPTTHTETVGGVTHTWTNYTNAGGTEGPSISTGQSVQVACVVNGFRVADGNTAWYRIASAPWSNNYYASADAFYNNGETSGTLLGTPFVDPAVPGC